MTPHLVPLVSIFLFVAYVKHFYFYFLLNFEMLLELSNFVGICIILEDLYILGCLDVGFMIGGLEVG